MGRRRRGEAVHGWLILDKPVGPTSTEVLNRCRHLLNARKAGHVGTLDPLASGVLPIAFGEATKCVTLLAEATKRYSFTVSFRGATTTDDSEGEITASVERRPENAEIEALLPRFRGRVGQVPPTFSAIKVSGRRAYDLARDGARPTLHERLVEIFDLRLVGRPDADHADFELHCGKGTYVRSLARDLGRALGIPAHVSALRRTAVGPFTVAAAISLAEFEALCHKRAGLEGLSPIETALDDIPALALSGEQADRLRHGQAVRVLDFTLGNDLLVCAMHNNRPVALARYADEQVEPMRVFNL